MNQEQFIKKINIVLVEIDKMINNCDEYSYTNKQQLISIKNELYDMINYLNSESIFQQKKGKEFLLSRIVIDSWPFNNEVGKLLVEIEEDFNSLTIKMSKLKILNETPLDFQEKNIFDQWEVSYLDLMEVNQGSPLVGSLSINGQVIIKEQGFGGPLLYSNRKIYIPVFIRRFWVVGFRLATLNLDDLSIEYIGGIEDLVYLKEIKGNRIYFYTDIYKSTEKNLTLYEQI
ncbi:hypothetical protein [Streptococcus infantis]|uniref:Uncharacterized protein n=1 Tax=Streptococcus infantis ATCC 700779 TaxID=889204 RepID=E8JZI2_9STRE|nr:hypothetical protein [Streptococcus infantis]EFX37001.1 hypothetical protein HMPREF9423_0645 [Streptococcus infantis ATCC 700779]EIG39860.1 hypothetical protein HMPREF1111_0732 [Streptococcus infantis ATCC 700779]SUN81748.1 Uncharacterised protein [Streptococcus infantis]